MREQVPDGDRVVDERQVVAEQRAGQGVKRQDTALDQTQDSHGGECLCPTGDSEARARGVADRVSPVRQAVCRVHHPLPGLVHPHHPGEAGAFGGLVDGVGEAVR